MSRFGVSHGFGNVELGLTPKRLELISMFGLNRQAIDDFRHENTGLATPREFLTDRFMPQPVLGP